MKMDFGPIYIDHIGIATPNLNEGSHFWSLLGLKQGEVDERVDDQGVVTRFFATDQSNKDSHPPNIELLEPTGEDTPIGKFLQKRGPGIQQLCLSVSDLPGGLWKTRRENEQTEGPQDLRNPSKRWQHRNQNRLIPKDLD